MYLTFYHCSGSSISPLCKVNRNICIAFELYRFWFGRQISGKILSHLFYDSIYIFSCKLFNLLHYEIVNGIYFPFECSANVNGHFQCEKIKWKSVEQNLTEQHWNEIHTVIILTPHTNTHKWRPNCSGISDKLKQYCMRTHIRTCVRKCVLAYMKSSDFLTAALVFRTLVLLSINSGIKPSRPKAQMKKKHII